MDDRINAAIHDEIDSLVDSRLKIVLVGCGTFAEGLLRETRLKEAFILAAADNDPEKRGSEFWGLRVIGIPEIPSLKPDAVVMTVGRYVPSLVRQLEELKGAFEIRFLPGIVLYSNELKRVNEPTPILADFPQFVAAVGGENRFAAPTLIMDKESSLRVKSWRYSYNCRGIVELDNFLEGKKTAVIVIHPWASDGDNNPVMKTPEPAGFYCLGTKEKNNVYRSHVDEVLNPFLQWIRPKVSCIVYTLPSSGKGMESEKKKQLEEFRFSGDEINHEMVLRGCCVQEDYFKEFPGRGASERYNGKGFWELPIPVTDAIGMGEGDMFFYDAEGYLKGRDILRAKGIRHVLLCGYTTERCLKNSVFGYEFLKKDFNIWVVGDATLANFPACSTPAYATHTALCEISPGHFITQVSWITDINRGRQEF